MALPFYNWSRTAASNATADSTVSWAEGQLPSTVNDSARAMMASTAAYRDDTAGAIATGGTSTAYTLTTYQVFSSFTVLNGQVVAFTPHTTNGATVTLNVDGLGAKALRPATGVELPAGVLVQGTPYAALYNSSNNEFILYGFFESAYNIPIGASMDWWGTTAPSSSFVFMYGQQVSQATYATLYSRFGANAYGADGGGLFYLPDVRGRVTAGKDDMGGSSANRLTNADDGLNGDTLGATGGGETQTLVTGNLPAYTPAGSVTTNITNGTNVWRTGSSFTVAGGGSFTFDASNVTASSSFTGTPQGGTSTAFGVIQPTIVCNKLLRII